MVREEYPGIAGRLTLGKKSSASLKEITPVRSGKKDGASFDTSYDDVMEHAGRIEAESAGHGRMVAGA